MAKLKPSNGSNNSSTVIVIRNVPKENLETHIRSLNDNLLKK